MCSRRLLGGVIGNEDGKMNYVESMVKRWKSDVERLSMIGNVEPQAAFSAFTKSLQGQWNYLQRVVPDCETKFFELESVIAEKFLPAVFGCEISSIKRDLFSLPARMGGLGVNNPTETFMLSYSISREATKVIREAIVSRAVSRARDERISSWLTVSPLRGSHFDLSAQEFRDALAIRYKKPLLNMPAVCDGCGSPFDLAHALSCKKGGLVIQQHNEVRDALGDLSALIWTQVTQEPVVREANSEENIPALRADLGVQGVWFPQSEVLFDIKVVDTDSQHIEAILLRMCLVLPRKEKSQNTHLPVKIKELSSLPCVVLWMEC